MTSPFPNPGPVETPWRGARRNRDEEGELQRTIVAWLEAAASPHCWWYMVNNGGRKTKAAARRDKLMGLRAGTADLAFVLPSGLPSFMELKSSTGRLSPEQKAFRKWCDDHNVIYALCADIDHALGVLRAWEVLPGERA